MVMEIGDVIRIGNYGRYSTENYGVNTLYVKIGALTLYFSYDTVVAFEHPDYGLVVCENVFSVTTGKHINWIDTGNKKGRVSHEEFEKLLNEVMKKTLPSIFKDEEEENRRKLLEEVQKIEDELNRIWKSKAILLQI